MVSFKSFIHKSDLLFTIGQTIHNQTITEGVKIKHLDHIEDLVFLYGLEGAEDTIKLMDAIYHDVQGHKTLLVQQKVDGAPSVIAGINPENGKFFVATKSLFNKVPKINYTDADIEANHGHAPGLVTKLKIALKYFPKTIKKGILQGDMMFEADDVKSTTIDGVKGLIFTPNTISFFIPDYSKLFHIISTAKVGVIWHTVYSGNTIDSLSASFNISDDYINRTKDVYVRTPMIQIDQAGWTDDEDKRMKEALKSMKNSYSKMNKNYISEIHNNEDLKKLILTYMNVKVRNGEKMKKNEIAGLWDYIKGRYQVQIDKLKTDKSKAKKTAERDIVLDGLNKNAGTLYHLFSWVYFVQGIKGVVIDKMNQLNFPESPYMRQADGSFQVADPEGFVVSDSSKDRNVKFVNRAVFSLNNFNNMKFGKKA